MVKARQKGVRKTNENKNKSTRNKWGPPRVHRMNWKIRFRELTGWKPKNDEEQWRMVKNLHEIAHGNVSEALQKAQVGLVAICTPLFTKYTPFAFFVDSFSVMLRNFTDYVTTLIFFPECRETLRITQQCPFWLPECHGTSRIT